MNLYGFAGGDPVNFSDPLGLCPPVWLCKLANFSAGFGDAVTGGATNVIREAIDANGTIDRGSGSYVVGMGVGVAAAAVTLGTVTAALGAGGEGTSLSQGTDFVVNTRGSAVAVPQGAAGPSAPSSGTGMVYTGGQGGPGMDGKTTGVRIMDANQSQGRRVNYMNKKKQTVDPKSGQTISKKDPRGHVPYP